MTTTTVACELENGEEAAVRFDEAKQALIVSTANGQQKEFPIDLAKRLAEFLNEDCTECGGEPEIRISGDPRVICAECGATIAYFVGVPS